MGTSRTIARWVFLAVLLAVLSAAIGLRLYRLSERPLGLHYDEAANAILAGEIARGLKRPIFIAAYTGKEVLFFYWAALWMKLFGFTSFALRLAAASIGIVTVAVAAWAVHELLHDCPDAPWIALTSAAFLAVSFWHLMLSRYGFRAITQPLLQALTVAALWRWLRPAPHENPGSVHRIWLVVAGLFCGLTAYTYLAARAFPLPLAAALVTLIVADQPRRRQRLAQSALFVGLAALVLAPLAYYWLVHPGSFMTRTTQVAADSWDEVASGLVACLRMFFLQGDPYIRFNVPSRPLFSPVVAGLFLLGLGVGAWRVIRPVRASDGAVHPLSLSAHVFLLTSIPVMLLPSALATGEITPSNLRTVGLLPFIYVFPALGLWALVTLSQRLFAGQSQFKRLLLPAACLLILGLSVSGVTRTYMAWSSSPALYYAADGDLASIAHFLNGAELSSITPYVASRHYRHPTVAFLAEDYDDVRWLVGGRTLVFPAAGDALFLFPRSASENLDWVHRILPEDTVAAAPLGPDAKPAFLAYRGTMAEAPVPAQPRSVNFGHVARLIGYTVTNQPRSGGSVDVSIWWSVTGTADQPDYRPVARLADQWGSIWGATQPLHYPSEQWMTGDLIVDHLSIAISPGAPPGDYVVRFGLHAPGADARLPALDEAGAYAGLYAELPVDVARAADSPPVEEMGIDRRLDAAINSLTLLGVRLDSTTARPGEHLYATLFWRAGEGGTPPHQVSLQLGERTIYRGDPVHDTYPFSDWEPGEVVADRYDPRLPLDMTAGRHDLKLQVEDQRTINLGEITVQATDRNFDIPSLSHPLTTTLGRRVQLLGYDLSSDSVAPGDTLVLTLTWQALTEMTTDYTVFAHLQTSDGVMAGQQDHQPVEGTYPTSLWAPGEVITDVYEIPARATSTPGEYWLKVGMYVADTGTRLSIENNADDAIVLQTVSVAE